MKLTTLRLWAILVGKTATSTDLHHKYTLNIINDKIVLITDNKKTGKIFGEEINEDNIELFKNQKFFNNCLTSLKNTL